MFRAMFFIADAGSFSAYAGPEAAAAYRFPPRMVG